MKLGQRAFYTGPQGSTATNAEVVEEKPGNISFRTTQPLGPYEGLTVAVAFPKGIVAEPGSGSRLQKWLSDYGPPAAGFLALLGLCGFYYVAWKRAGRNPRAGTVVPIFEPPVDLTPAGMRYVMKMGADDRGPRDGRCRRRRPASRHGPRSGRRGTPVPGCARSR